MNTESHGRVRQRQRTLTTLLDAAVEMIGEGRTPTIAEVAERAEISRATAYRYFASQDAMLMEAVLHGAVPDIPQALSSAGAAGDVEERLALVVRIVNRWVTERESGFRAYLRQSLDPNLSDASADGDDGSPGPRRGGRRIAWIEEALAPVRAEMDPERFRDLAGALSLFLGIETKIVLKDIWEMDDAEAERVALWATRALLREALLPDEKTLPAS
jgi:AcrR family transcriptional regulator